MQKYHLKYHTGYIGRLKTKYYRDLVLDKPEMLVEYSVRRMLPKNWLSEDKIKNLTVLRDQEHDFPGRLPKVRSSPIIRINPFGINVVNKSLSISLPKECQKTDRNTSLFHLVFTKASRITPTSSRVNLTLTKVILWKCFLSFLDRLFLTGKDVIVDPNFEPPRAEDDSDLYHYYYDPKDYKLAQKEFQRWLKEAKTKKDWRPRRVFKQAPLSNKDDIDIHLFTSDKQIQKYGFNWIYQELEKPDVFTI